MGVSLRRLILQDLIQANSSSRKRDMLFQAHIVESLTTIDQEAIRVVLEDLNRARVHRTSRGSVLLPLINIPSIRIRIHLPSISVGDHNGPIRSAQRAPDNIGTRVWRRGVVDDDRTAFLFPKLQGRVGHHVVDGVVYAVGGGVADGQFVDEDPLLDGRDVRDDGHAGAGEVLVVRNVVDDGAPGLQVGRCLMGEFLAVFGVALVGVVGC